MTECRKELKEEEEKIVFLLLKILNVLYVQY
jgi:hypothetical protein